MEITSIGYLSIPIILWIIYKYDLKKIMFMTLLLSTLSATSVINFTILGFSLMIGQFSGILFILKTAYLIYKKEINYKIKINTSLIVFMVIATISLVFPLIFSKGVIVLTPNDQYAEVRFNFQMITQFAYLLLGVITLICAAITCNNFRVLKDDFIYTCKVVIYTFIVLVLFQMVIPFEKYNYIFRAAHFANNQWLPGNILRLTGPTAEASIFAFTCMPIIAIVLFDSIRLRRFKECIAPVILLAMVASTKSSTFLVALAIIMAIYMIYIFKNYDCVSLIKSLDKKWRIIGSVTIVVLFIVIGFVFKDTIIILINKIIGVGESGQARTTALIHHLKVFLKYPLTGVGFGTIRSYDLLSMWLASIGIVGMIAISIYIGSIILNLINDKEYIVFSIYLGVMVINLLISVPEPYYLFVWIVIGIMQFYNSNNEVIMNEYNEISI